MTGPRFTVYPIDRDREWYREQLEARTADGEFDDDEVEADEE